MQVPYRLSLLKVYKKAVPGKKGYVVKSFGTKAEKSFRQTEKLKKSLEGNTV
jgi:hypothetical protein